MIASLCDRCGSPISDAGEKDYVDLVVMVDGEESLVMEDLCPRCSRQLAEVLDRFRKNVDWPEREGKPDVTDADVPHAGAGDVPRDEPAEPQETREEAGPDVPSEVREDDEWRAHGARGQADRPRRIGNGTFSIPAPRHTTPTEGLL